MSDTPIAIERDAVSRFLDVEANVSGRSLGDVAGEIEDRLRGSVFPLEYHAEVITHTTASEIGSMKILLAAIAALLAIFLLMQAAFMSFRLALLGALVLPVALVGGVLAALINGADLSLGAAIGFFGLFALAARNTVAMIRHFQDLERQAGERFGIDLIRRGARERLTPILATASATAVAAIVFVILGSRPGLEILSPMAAVVLGGIVTTTLLSLFVLPALYLRFGGREPEHAPDETEAVLDEWVYARPTAAARRPETVRTAEAGDPSPAAESKDGGEPDVPGLPSPA
jgi:Cu/Ag efflux pump CusA